ncbi:hypothetical protein QYF36_027184 [Acer negundo]|nr:hypothetical protein QYF36_027184 [Acer negundo]
MEVISQRSSSSTLNPNAPMFIPFAYQTVKDFSDQWWSLIQSSPWFRDYWLQKRYFDSQIDDFSLPYLDDPFDDEFLKGGRRRRRGFEGDSFVGVVEMEKGSSSVC